MEILQLFLLLPWKKMWNFTGKMAWKRIKKELSVVRGEPVFAHYATNNQYLCKCDQISSGLASLTFVAAVLMACTQLHSI